MDEITEEVSEVSVERPFRNRKDGLITKREVARPLHLLICTRPISANIFSSDPAGIRSTFPQSNKVTAILYKQRRCHMDTVDKPKLKR